MTTFCLHISPQTFMLIIDQFTNHGQGNFSHRLHNCNLQWVKILVPLGASSFFQYQPQFIVKWIEVWAGEGPVIRFDEIWVVLLQLFLCFSLCEWAQNPAESTSYLGPRIQFSPEVVWHRLTWLGRPHHLFLHWCCKNESELHRSTRPPPNHYQQGCDDPSEPLGFCLQLITTFGIYVFILVIEFLFNVVNVFIDKQDLMVCVFWNLFGNFLHIS